MDEDQTTIGAYERRAAFRAAEAASRTVMSEICGLAMVIREDDRFIDTEHEASVIARKVELAAVYAAGLASVDRGDV